MQIENIAEFILSAAYLKYHILWKLEQENRETKASLRNTMRPNLWGKKRPFFSPFHYANGTVLDPAQPYMRAALNPCAVVSGTKGGLSSTAEVTSEPTISRVSGFP